MPAAPNARASGERHRIAQGIEAGTAEKRQRLGSYVDGPRLARIGSVSMFGSLALICPAYFRILRPLAKMGFADSEIQTRERHFLPVNRAEHFTDRLAPNVPPLPFLQVPASASDLAV